MVFVPEQVLSLFMASVLRPRVLFLLTVTFLSSTSHQLELADDPPLIDRIVRDSAFRSYLSRRCKTADVFNVSLPPGLLPGVTAQAVRYRSGSLRRYGAALARFRIAPGVVARPRSKRLIVVAQNLGSLSSSAYGGGYGNLSGVRLISPVLGLAFYGADAAAVEPEVQILVTRRPITVDFAGLVEDGSPGPRPLCALFESDGSVSLSDAAASGDACSARRQGHFALVVDTGGVDEAGRGERKVCAWKVEAGVAAGAFSAALMGLVAMAMASKKGRRRKMRMAEMERRAHEEEVLRTSMVGRVRAPTAAAVRTAPSMENDEGPPL